METALGTARSEAQSGAEVRRRTGLRPQTAWAAGCLAVDVAMLTFAALAVNLGGSAAGKIGRAHV